MAHEARIERADGVLTLVLRGEIDISAASDVSVAGEQILAEAPAQLVVDLSGVTFLDSAGVGAIVALHNATTGANTAHGPLQLLLREGPPNVMRVLEIVGLSDAFERTA
jgi:anti-sigma B factor antagonist